MTPSGGKAKKDVYLKWKWCQDINNKYFSLVKIENNFIFYFHFQNCVQWTHTTSVTWYIFLAYFLVFQLQSTFTLILY